MIMKRNNLLLLLLFTCLGVLLQGQNFVVGGIAYKVVSTTQHTVSVTNLMSVTGQSYRGNVNIPATVVHNGITYDVVALDESAFYACTLSGVTIPPSVTAIGASCFLYANGPASLTLPASISEIGSNAFLAFGMNNIFVDTTNPYYCSVGGILYTKDTTTIIKAPAGKTGTLTLPTTTKNINNYAFGYCNTLTGINLPNGLRNIGSFAFFCCSHMSSLVIPSSVTYIGASPFAACYMLTNLSIAEENSHYVLDGTLLYSINRDTLVSCHRSGDSVFPASTLRVLGGFSNNNNIKYVYVPDSVNTLSSYSFSASTLRSITMPRRMSLIDNEAFSACDSLTHVDMPTMLDSMSYFAFENCHKLSSIVIPNGLRVIPYGAFITCNLLANITWGNAVEIIDSVAFAGFAVKNISLPATVREVKCMAFGSYGDSQLKTVTFNGPVELLESDVFYSNSLQRLTLVNDNPPATTEDGCLNLTYIDSIIIPCGSTATYAADSYWSQFANKYYENCNGIDAADNIHLSLFPNPANNVVTLQSETAEETAKVEIYDLCGRLLDARQLSLPGEIDIANIPCGTYIVKVATSQGSCCHKVAVKR